MIENNTNDLEKIINQYAFDRLKKSKLVPVLNKIMPNRKKSEIKMPEQYNTSIKRTGYYLKEMIQVFIDILKNTHRDIHISQIASIIIAETNYLLNIRS